MSWWHVSKFPTCPPILSLSSILPCTFLLLSCSSYAISSMLKASICKKKIITYQGLGCSILSLATGIPSLALAAACPAHNLKLSVCVAYGHQACFTSGPLILGPTHILSRGCLWSLTQPRLCCLWTRACFTPGPYSALHLYLLAAAYGPAHNYVCVAYGPAPA